MGKSPLSYALILALTGCATQSTWEHNEFKTALRQIKDEHLVECVGLGERPENSVAGFYTDFIDLAGICAPCRERHNELVRYLRPLVEKAKASK